MSDTQKTLTRSDFDLIALAYYQIDISEKELQYRSNLHTLWDHYDCDHVSKYRAALELFRLGYKSEEIQTIMDEVEDEEAKLRKKIYQTKKAKEEKENEND